LADINNLFDFFNAFDDELSSEQPLEESELSHLLNLPKSTQFSLNGRGKIADEFNGRVHISVTRTSRAAHDIITQLVHGTCSHVEIGRKGHSQCTMEEDRIAEIRKRRNQQSLAHAEKLQKTENIKLLSEIVG
jgi:hypothetical protein